MRRDSQLMKAYWPKIRNTVFQTVINNNLREGEFNYDSDIAVYQLRNADINCTHIEGFDLVKCNITGIIENCNLIVCEVNNARILNSKIVKGTDISDSYLRGVTVESENTLDNCFVENNYEILNCEIKNSILKFAGLGRESKLLEGTILIDREEKLQQPASVGIQVEEIKDYKWLKNLLGPHVDKGFGNEFNKKTYI
jgi:hypothetical protein